MQSAGYSSPLLSREMRLCTGDLTYNHNAIRESQGHLSTLAASSVHYFSSYSPSAVFRRRWPCENVNLFNSNESSKRRVAGIFAQVYSLPLQSALPLKNQPPHSYRSTKTTLTLHQFYAFTRHIRKFSRHPKHTSEWSERDARINTTEVDTTSIQERTYKQGLSLTKVKIFI